MRISKYILSAITGLLACLYSCTDVRPPEAADMPRDPEHPLAVNLTAARTFMTRVGSKQSFEQGDVIQVFATFNLPDNGSEVKYACMMLDATGQWINTDDAAAMTWPIDAETGDFEAYYIPQAAGPLTAGEPVTVLLDTVTDETDPLRAEITSVTYGYAVNLLFSHLCTRLILENVKEDSSKEYWLTLDDESGADILKNAYTFVRRDDNSGEFGFAVSGVPDEANPVKIARTKEDDGSVVFYLAPGSYDGMKLNYSYYRPYLSFKEVSDGAGNKVLNGLEANSSYVLNINKALGVINEESENEWSDPVEDEPVELDGIEDIEAFLNAIRNVEDYYVNEVEKVLEVNSLGMVTLLKNVDFKWLNGGISGTVPSTIIFNGNYHYIMNLADALFSDVQGNVTNLGIKGVEIDYTADSSEGVYKGALTDYNQGTIDNIRIEDCEIAFHVPDGTGKTYNIGTLIGGNTQSGKVSDIVFGGSLTISADGKTSSYVNLGGVIGQNGGQFESVSYLDDESNLAVTDMVTGTGELSVGGIVGYNSGTVSKCVFTVDVHANGDEFVSCGESNYVGGIIGNMDSGILSECAIAGNVYGGDATRVDDSHDNADALAYTGGLCGVVGKAEVDDCAAFNQVTGYVHESSASDGRANAVGGAFGGLNRVDPTIRNCIVWKVPEGSEYVGLFAGVWLLNFAGTDTGNKWVEADGKDAYGLQVTL